MLEMCLVVILLVGLISFGARLHAFNDIPKVQNKALNDFKAVQNGMSLSELNTLFGRKGHKVLNSSYKYRWNFGDSVVLLDKHGTVVPFTEFDKNIDNWHEYSFKRSPAYIEVDLVDGKNIGAKTVGLN